MAARQPNARIFIRPTGCELHPYVFAVSHRGKGWKNRQFLTWKEALHDVGLIPFEDIFR